MGRSGSDNRITKTFGPIFAYVGNRLACLAELQKYTLYNLPRSLETLPSEKACEMTLFYLKSPMFCSATHSIIQYLKLLKLKLIKYTQQRIHILTKPTTGTIHLRKRSPA